MPPAAHAPLPLSCACRMFLHGEYKAEDQEQMLADLDKMVADVYNKCIGPNEANMS